MRPSLKAKKIIDERRQHFRKVMAFENNAVICIEAVTMLFQHTLGDCGKKQFLCEHGLPFQCQRKVDFACCLKSLLVFCCLYRKVKLFSKLVIILSLFMKTKYNMNIFFIQLLLKICKV